MTVSIPLLETAGPPILDHDFLAELMDAIGEDGTDEVLRMFQEDAPERMAAIAAALSAGSVPGIRREAHALAGAARNVGLARLGDAAYALQLTTESPAGGDLARSIASLSVLTIVSLRMLEGWNDNRGLP